MFAMITFAFTACDSCDPQHPPCVPPSAPGVTTTETVCVYDNAGYTAPMKNFTGGRWNFLIDWYDEPANTLPINDTVTAVHNLSAYYATFFGDANYKGTDRSLSRAGAVGGQPQQVGVGAVRLSTRPQ